MAHVDSSPDIATRTRTSFSTVPQEKTSVEVVNHDVKDSEKGSATAKVFNPTSSFDVYGEEEGAQSMCILKKFACPRF